MATSITINTTDYKTGNVQQKTITDLNPNADSTKLATWAQMTAALSKDAYAKTVRTEKTDVDNATPKPSRTVSFIRYYRGLGASQTFDDVPEDGVIDLIINTDVAKALIIFIKTPFDETVPVLKDFHSTNNAVLVSYQYSFVSYANSDDCWRFALATHEAQAAQADLTPGTISFTLHFDESDEFAAFDKPFTINITEE